jgi:hypothetical protein
VTSACALAESARSTHAHVTHSFCTIFSISSTLFMIFHTLFPAGSSFVFDAAALFLSFAADFWPEVGGSFLCAEPVVAALKPEDEEHQCVSCAGVKDFFCKQ